MEKNLKHPLPMESVAALPDIPASEPRVRPAYPEIARHAGSHEFLSRLTESAITPGHRPPTLPFRARPQRAEWPVDKPRSGSHSNIKPLDTVIPPPPDGRYPFYDPVYPWSAFGRVTSGQFPTPLISASGVMGGSAAPAHVEPHRRLARGRPHGLARFYAVLLCWNRALRIGLRSEHFFLAPARISDLRFAPRSDGE